MATVELEQGRIHYRDEGSGPPIVLVHGIAVSSRYMVPVAEELAPFASVHAPDLPGFGRSAKPRRTLTVPELARALLAWLDAAGLERPLLLGNSLGCQVVVDLAAREARRGGQRLALTFREFDLLAFLLQHPKEAFDRSALLLQVWSWSFGDASTVTVHVRRLREKLEDDPSHPRRIVTVFGIGYRYEPQGSAP